MTLAVIRLLSMFVLLIGSSHFAMAQNVNDTRLMSNPAVSANNIAFIYAEDLWVANKNGLNPRRLTIDKGVESLPVFSPDGYTIAFSAEYDGNVDVFTVPVAGGVPKRLTWHPSADLVRDFTPNGNSVLFSSQRSTYTNRHAKLYTVSTTGGQPQELSIPTAFSGAYSPDGLFIAYSPLYETFNQWKNYRGGTQSRIWLFNTKTNAVMEVPKPTTGSNDADPQWLGNTLYFKSDRDGEFNIYSYDLLSKAVAKLTSFTNFPVINIAAGSGQLLFEQAGYLHLMDPKLKTQNKLTIAIATDLLEMRPRFVSGGNYIRTASISPSGARVVFDFRGEVVTAPAEKGDVMNLTQTGGTHEKFPQWSPDGKSIAYFSDASGEYALHVKNIDEGLVKKLPLNGSGFYAFLHWSPDNKKLSYVDNSRKLYVLEVTTGKIFIIAADQLYTPGVFRELFGSWSPDSKWLSYTTITETNFEQAYIYSFDQNKSFALSDGLANVTNPTFDPGGKYIYMLASTDAGPVVNWFDQSNQDMEDNYSIYLITLQKETESPLAKQNDEEKGKEEKPSEKKSDAPPVVKIDFDNISQRIISLPLAPGHYSNLALSEEGKLFYLSRKPHAGPNMPQSLRMFDIKERKDKEIMEADGFEIAANGKKMLYLAGEAWGVTDVGKKPEAGKINTGAIQVKIDPKQEWGNIFDEAWRVNRDYFYDPNMQGADWPAMKKKYSVFIEDIAARSDLYRVMQWMFSELAVGHHRFSGTGDKLYKPEKVKGGLLGADFETANNHYRFKKIYGGLNWTPDLRSPLTQPGVNIKEGEYLLAVDGKPLNALNNFFSFFENTADKIVELTVGPDANGTNSRKVKVVPVADEQSLRNRDWIEGNIRKVNEATNNQVAYVYVPNTAEAGHEYFKRYFFPQVNKKAIIIDERFNGGGQLADYYIDILKKPYQSSWNFRYGKDLKAPNGSIQGPKVMLIDETAGSGGDYLPFLFRKFNVGTLVGKRTWGGLVGILGYPEFIDGGSVTAPNLAFYTEDGFKIENEGVAPDVEVEQWPKDVIAGKDPQLEKAIEIILQQLKQNPPMEVVRPPYPVRVTKNK